MFSYKESSVIGQRGEGWRREEDRAANVYQRVKSLDFSWSAEKRRTISDFHLANTFIDFLLVQMFQMAWIWIHDLITAQALCSHLPDNSAKVTDATNSYAH